jgi:AAA15 family ATPase/GTPase
MPALYQMRRGHAVFFIDEIDRSMHPMLVHKFIEYFLTCTAGACQIILTTHETHLLTLEMLRRDEMWFAEKDPAGATNLYSLADFNVRGALRLRNGYLEGRFGAVPFLGDIARLIDSRSGPAVCH